MESIETTAAEISIRLPFFSPAGPAAQFEPETCVRILCIKVTEFARSPSCTSSRPCSVSASTEMDDGSDRSATLSVSSQMAPLAQLPTHVIEVLIHWHKPFGRMSALQVPAAPYDVLAVQVCSRCRWPWSSSLPVVYHGELKETALQYLLFAAEYRSCAYYHCKWQHRCYVDKEADGCCAFSFC